MRIGGRARQPVPAAPSTSASGPRNVSANICCRLRRDGRRGRGKSPITDVLEVFLEARWERGSGVGEIDEGEGEYFAWQSLITRAR